MIIAKYGSFVLATKVYGEPHEYFVRDIEIEKENAAGNVTLAYFSKEGALTSCGRRLLDNIDTQQDLEDVRKLAEIATLIFEGENTKSGFTM